MTQQHRTYPNLYKDSVALMTISSKLMKLGGIEAASVVMATDANRENLGNAGLADVDDAGPNDLLVAVRGTEEACQQALDQADQLLNDEPEGNESSGTVQEQPASSIQQALARDETLNLALISVPGEYAGAEALKALRLGLDVMLFSDNVPIEQEIEIKRYAQSRQLLVMGPDCGTALVNGVPLGFANVVNRGRIGVIGASGTGIQEITCRIHQLGEGVSQALGTGGRDLSTEVGGVSALQALERLATNEATEVVVLVSKPPAAEVAETLITRARELSKPVVVMFVGAEGSLEEDARLRTAPTLADAADIAVALARGETPEPAPSDLPANIQAMLREQASQLNEQQRYVRGIYSGGTFCYEAQLVCQAQGVSAYSNTPIRGNDALEDIWTSRENTIIDMGDDTFTQGRPHPMIDPTLRNERLLDEARDPSTAVLLFDVVLGYGAAADPSAELLEVLERIRREGEESGRQLPIVTHVCGTDEDPQQRSRVVDALRQAGALVAENNAQAARMAAFIATFVATQQSPSTHTGGK